MKRFLKPAVALVAVLGLLSFLAPPSAATSGTLTGGTLTVNLTPAIVTTFGGTSTTSIDCGSSITALDSSTGTSGSTGVSGTVTITMDSAFLYQGTWYHFVGTTLNTATPPVTTGSYTSSHNTDSTYNITVHFNFIGRIYTPASQTDPCASGTLLCGPISATSFTLTGTATLTAVHPGPVGTLHLAGNRTLSTFGCGAPFTAMNGKTATLASVTASLS